MVKSLRMVDLKTIHRRATPPTTRLPFKVRTVGRIRSQPFHSTLGTYHSDAMMTVCCAGRGTYLHEGNQQIVERGMIGLVLPRGDVGLLMSDREDPYDHYYCRFGGSLALKLAGDIQLDAEGKRFFPCPQWSNAAEILERMRGVRPMSEHRTEHFNLLDAMLAELLAMLSARDHPRDDQHRLTRESVLEFMRHNISQPIDLGMVASHFGICKPHLCRIARSLLGGTIHKVWMRMKMEWAQSLLIQSPLSIADVARRVGFKDAFYFSKVFKGMFGLSPAVWREANIHNR